MPLPAFAELARRSEPPLDVLALALAAEFGSVDADAALGRLDALGEQLAGRAGAAATSPQAAATACAQLLGGEHGFTGDRRHYDDPGNSMLDRVLIRRRGLPIVLSVVYAEVARRAGIALRGVGLAGHFVVGHFGVAPPLLLDPFAGGAVLDAAGVSGPVRPWPAPAIAMRMLNNLVASFERRGDVGRAIRACEMRLALPVATPLRAAFERELAAQRARLN